MEPKDKKQVKLDKRAQALKVNMMRRKERAKEMRTATSPLTEQNIQDGASNGQHNDSEKG